MKNSTIPQDQSEGSADKSTGSVNRKTTRPVIQPCEGGEGLLAWQPSSRFSKRPCLTETGQKITRVLVLPLASVRTRTHIHHTQRAQEVKGQTNYLTTTYHSGNGKTTELGNRLPGVKGLSQGVDSVVTQVFYLHCSGYINFYIRKMAQNYTYIHN